MDPLFCPTEEDRSKLSFYHSISKMAKHITRRPYPVSVSVKLLYETRHMLPCVQPQNRIMDFMCSFDKASSRIYQLGNLL